MEFILKFPDSCYNEDVTHYSLFINALQGMLNRMATSHNKYQKGLPMDFVVQDVDEIKSAMKRIAMYDPKHVAIFIQDELFSVNKEMNTGNVENLLDAANMLVIEAILPKHSKAHMRSQASHESPGLEYKE